MSFLAAEPVLVLTRGFMRWNVVRSQMEAALVPSASHARSTSLLLVCAGRSLKGPVRVKIRKTLNEYMFSALAPIAHMGRGDIAVMI